MIIDSHVHVWDLTRADYPWLAPEIGALYRSIGFDEIEPTLREHGITGAVLVQASDEAGDTAVMLDAAAEHPAILGVVAWSPLDDPARMSADLERFADDPLVVGIRNLVHEHPRGWLNRDEVEDSLALLAAHGMPLDFPTSTPAALAELPGIGARHPDLRIVIDHLGKPPIGGDGDDRAEWLRLIRECARNPRTVAKLSGLYAARGPLDSWTVDTVLPFVEDALELFGPDRLMYGGDWPIAELAGGYRHAWNAIPTLLSTLSARERTEVLGGTAIRVYGLSHG